MGKRVEAAEHYLLSVAERATGFSAYRKLVDEKGVGERPQGLINALLQLLLLPTTINFVTDVAIVKRELRSFPEELFKAGSAEAMDIFGTLILPAVLSHSSTEFLAWKAAGNVAVHVGMDLIDVGIRGGKRLFRNFRPSGSALVV